MKTLPVNLRDGLQLWIDGSNNGSTTYYDVSGAGFSGTSTAVTNGRSLQHKTMKFDGNTSKILIPNNAAFNITGNITLSCRFKKRVNSQTGGLIGKGGPYESSDSGYEIYFYSADNKIYFDAKLGSTDRQMSTAAAITSTNRHFLVCSYDGSTMKIYINGLLNNSASYSGSIATNSLSLSVGARNNGTGTTDDAINPFDGIITNSMLWNRVLSDTEIQQLYISQYIK